jgi:hypothetical protein
VTEIEYKVREAVAERSDVEVRAAAAAVLDMAAKWRETGLVGAAFADEVLMALGEPLGLRLTIGQYAQLVEVVDRNPPCGHSTMLQYEPRCCTPGCPNYAGGYAR